MRSSITLEPSDTAGLLKAADKTYSLRQKNTSNALMLLSVNDGSLSSSQMPEAGLNVIATLHETVELVPETADAAAPAAVARGRWHEKFGRSR